VRNADYTRDCSQGLADNGEQLTRAVPVGDGDGGYFSSDKGKVSGIDFV
jgi:hypothetical protein